MANKKYNKYMLKGSLRKNGFDRWRLVTNGINSITGEERTFFIEFYIVNPALNTDEYTLGYKSTLKTSEEDLQYALAGTLSANSAAEEIIKQPSFVMVKAGCLGTNGKHINTYFPSSKFEVGHKEFIIRAVTDRLAAGGGEGACVLSDRSTRGKVQVSYADLNIQPELLCNHGKMEWDLQYRIFDSYDDCFAGVNSNWTVPGAKVQFSGTIILDGEEYNVYPKNSFGYIDKEWGKEFNEPFFHLSTSNMTSSITGKPLEDSFFIVHGESNGALSVIARIEGQDHVFLAENKKKFEQSFNFTQCPKDEEGEKVHWSVSVSNKKYVIDLEIFCNTNSMFVRDYECPSGNRKLMKILGGGTGIGSIKLFQRIKKNLVQLEEATVNNTLCEYGQSEYWNH